MAIAVIDDCKNKKESYGEICVRCNLCGRFNNAKPGRDKEKSEIKKH